MQNPYTNTGDLCKATRIAKQSCSAVDGLQCFKCWLHLKSPYDFTSYDETILADLHVESSSSLHVLYFSSEMGCMFGTCWCVQARCNVDLRPDDEEALFLELRCRLVPQKEGAQVFRHLLQRKGR